MCVSVVIPTYNSGCLVVEAVESVLRQTWQPRQVIVIDDGSTDDTAQRLRPYFDRVDYVQQPNGGVATARNVGLALTMGDFVAFLDADDTWHPQKLERQMAVLSQQPQVGLLATELTPWPGDFASVDTLGGAAVAPVPLAEMLTFNPLATSSVVVRREVLDRVGRFDTTLCGPEDYDLWLRCAQATQVAILNEPLTGYRDTLGSLGKQAEPMRRGLLAIHAKLDKAGVWPNAWFRRKCRAQVDYTSAYMFYADGRHRHAARLLMQSLAAYPWPLSHRAVRYYFARLRLLFRSSLAATVTTR